VGALRTKLVNFSNQDSNFGCVSESRETPSLLYALHVASIAATANKVQNIRHKSSKLWMINLLKMFYVNCLVKIAAIKFTKCFICPNIYGY